MKKNSLKIDEILFFLCNFNFQIKIFLKITYQKYDKFRNVVILHDNFTRIFDKIIFLIWLQLESIKFSNENCVSYFKAKIINQSDVYFEIFFFRINSIRIE